MYLPKEKERNSKLNPKTVKGNESKKLNISIYIKQENKIKVGSLKILIKPDIPLAKLINKRKGTDYP